MLTSYASCGMKMLHIGGLRANWGRIVAVELHDDRRIQELVSARHNGRVGFLLLPWFWCVKYG